jgi:predicted permease
VTVLFSIFASDILPIFLIAGIGLLIARWRSASVKTVADVVFYALVPCLAFNLLVTSTVIGPETGRMALLAVLVPAVMGLLARAVAIPLRLNRAELSAFLLVVMISNSGNYGLPLVLFAFGMEALSHATVYYVASSMLTYTIGVFIAASGKRSARNAFVGIGRVPGLYGVAAALIVLASGISVPLALMRPIGLLSDAALPMMILALGMQLDRVKFADRPSVASIAVGLSLVVAPFVALGLTSILGLTGPARQAGVALASTPVAVITTILAVEYDVAPAFVTSTVFISTLLSPITLTLLIAYLQ